MIARSSNLLRLNAIWLPSRRTGTFPPAFEWPRRDLGTVVQDLMARTLPGDQDSGLIALRFFTLFLNCTPRCPPAHSSVAQKKEEARTREPARRASSTEAAQGHAPRALVRVSLFVARRRLLAADLRNPLGPPWYCFLTRSLSEPIHASAASVTSKLLTVAGQLSGMETSTPKAPVGSVTTR